MLAIVNISHQYESRGKSIKFTKKCFLLVRLGCFLLLYLNVLFSRKLDGSQEYQPSDQIRKILVPLHTQTWVHGDVAGKRSTQAKRHSQGQ